MTYTEIEDLIKAQIRNNGEKAITGQVLQDVLLAMIAPHAQREHPFTLTALEGGVFNLAKGDLSYDQIALEFRKNEGEWAAYEFGTPITCAVGDTIQLRGDNEAMCYIDPEDGSQFPYWNWQGFSGSWKASGNIMSLLHKETFAKATSVPYAAFASFFSERGTGGFAQLADASELVLPAATLAVNCYGGMFRGCTGLTAAPELPATTLVDSCYRGMFRGCTGLTSAPELPATKLANGCYDSMFRDCTGLTSTPALPAATLAASCYSYMFNGCTGLNEVRCHATAISEDLALFNWLTNVASTGIFYKAMGVTYPSGASGIPSGWTVREIA